MPHQNMHFALTAASVTIDIEKRVINVSENQQFAEVCLVKSGPSSHPITAVLSTDEITDGDGSPREPSLCVATRKKV